MNRRLLFRLDGVDQDEVNEVRALLDQHGIVYYETPGGKWGISVAGLWVADSDHWQEGRDLLERYAKERAQRSRSEWVRQQRMGLAETFIQRSLRRPLALLGSLGFAGLILYLSLAPFLAFLAEP